MHWTRPVPGRQVLLPSPWGFWLECRAPVRSGVKAAALISLYRRSSPPMALGPAGPGWPRPHLGSGWTQPLQEWEVPKPRKDAGSLQISPPDLLPLWLHQLRFSRAEDGPRLPLSCSLPLLLHLPGKTSCSRLLLDNPYLIHKQNSLVPTACQSLYQALGMQQRTGHYLPH